MNDRQHGSFLPTVAVISLKIRARNSAIQKELGGEPLLLYITKSQLRFLNVRISLSGEAS